MKQILLATKQAAILENIYQSNVDNKCEFHIFINYLGWKKAFRFQFDWIFFNGRANHCNDIDIANKFTSCLTCYFEKVKSCIIENGKNSMRVDCVKFRLNDKLDAFE